MPFSRFWSGRVIVTMTYSSWRRHQQTRRGLCCKASHAYCFLRGWYFRRCLDAIRTAQAGHVYSKVDESYRCVHRYLRIDSCLPSFSILVTLCFRCLFGRGWQSRTVSGLLHQFGRVLRGTLTKNHKFICTNHSFASHFSHFSSLPRKRARIEPAMPFQ